MRSIYLLIAFFCTISLNSYATHNRAGEIIIDQIGDLSIRATIVTYTKASSTQADRDELTIFWGDGTSTIVKRSNGNGNGVSIGNDNKLNLYISEHTYSARGTYTISMTDPNRNGGILNVNPPNSVNVPFHIESVYTLLSPQFRGYNSSPRLLQPPIDIACTGRTFIHNPNAYDPDGDSLAYELIVPRSNINDPVPNYSFPNQISPGPDNNVFLDSESGNFIWDAPQRIGEYNIAMKIKEYRDGMLINTTIRDMQILVRACDNSPPFVKSIDEICVKAGDEIEIPVTVTDPDLDQKVKLEVYGGPVELPLNPASISVDRSYRNQPLNAIFTWQTQCNNIRNNSYTVIFRGVDDFYSTTGLSYLKNLSISVYGPPPEGLEVNLNADDKPVLRWDLGYTCENTDEGFFRGFQVWRKVGCSEIEIDSCDFDMEALGYEQVSFIVRDIENGKYQFTDDSAEYGKSYCYRVTAAFAKITTSGNPYNIVSSSPSDETCVQIGGNAPILTSVSVQKTSVTDGEVLISWDKPLLTEFDTIEHPGPYIYTLERRDNDNPSIFFEVPGASFTTPYFNQEIQRSFVDGGLNTQEENYTYRIAFYTQGRSNVYNYSSTASTIDLTLFPADMSITSQWEEDTPWNNFKYFIYFKSEFDTEFSLLDSTAYKKYLHNNLDNGIEYCYYIKSLGNYCRDELVDTFVNFSAIQCVIPRDTVPPCPPTLSISNLCTDNMPSAPNDELINTITWNFEESSCEEAKDIQSFKIYYSSDSLDYELIDSVTILDPYIIQHEPEDGISGCYYIIAVDSIGNQSKPSSVVCTRNCPDFELPNVFTPNGDNHHDFFVPRRSQFIESVDFSVFNQWGNLVFTTDDPQINWDGRDSDGNTLDEGTYFYKCIVYRRALGQSQLFTELTGFIELIR